MERTVTFVWCGFLTTRFSGRRCVILMNGNERHFRFRKKKESIAVPRWGNSKSRRKCKVKSTWSFFFPLSKSLKCSYSPMDILVKYFHCFSLYSTPNHIPQSSLLWSCTAALVRHWCSTVKQQQSACQQPQQRQHQWAAQRLGYNFDLIEQ